MALAVVIDPVFTAMTVAVKFTLFALLNNITDHGAGDSANHGAFDGIIPGCSPYGGAAYAPDERPAANAVSCTSAQQRGEGQAQYCDFHGFSFLVRR
jgi:hypothetical protein